MSIYSDIPYDLKIDEFGDLVVLVDTAAVQQSLKTIILTTIGAKTKYQQPIFGSGSAGLLFEKINPFTSSNLEEEINFAIENWEPRVSVDSIVIDSDTNKNKMHVSITYSIVSLNITEELTINLSVLS